MMANKNSFYYVLDRATGEYLHARQIARQNWASGIDETGRPILIPGREPSYEGVLVAPIATGGANWWAPSYNPNTELFYVTVHDGAQIYRRPRVNWLDEEQIARVEKSWSAVVDTMTFAAAVRALDPRTGEITWELPLPPHTSSGILTTASNLLFVGTSDGEFLAVDAVGGEVLWRATIDGWVNAGPISYLVDGQQFVSIATSEGLFTFGLALDTPTSPTPDQ
jgi:glucose dehydrogenase